MLRRRKCPENEDIPTSISLANRQSLTFGRDPRSDIVLKWDGVSRAHAWLDEVTLTLTQDLRSTDELEHLRNGTLTGWELKCNGSGNGSFINGVRQSRALLQDGDCVGFGHGHNICEGESLEDDYFVYEFVYESKPHEGVATAPSQA